MDPVIIRSRSKSIQCKLFWRKHKSSQTMYYYKDVTTMTEQTFYDGNFMYFFMAVAAMCCFPKLHWPLRFLHFQTQSLLRRMTLKENLFQAQTENQTQLQNYYPFYQHKIYSFTQYLLQGVKGLAYVIRIIPRIILILKIVFASIIS